MTDTTRRARINSLSNEIESGLRGYMRIDDIAAACEYETRQAVYLSAHEDRSWTNKVHMLSPADIDTAKAQALESFKAAAVVKAADEMIADLARLKSIFAEPTQ